MPAPHLAMRKRSCSHSAYAPVAALAYSSREPVLMPVPEPKPTSVSSSGTPVAATPAAPPACKGTGPGSQRVSRAYQRQSEADAKLTSASGSDVPSRQAGREAAFKPACSQLIACTAQSPRQGGFAEPAHTGFQDGRLTRGSVVSFRAAIALLFCSRI